KDYFPDTQFIATSPTIKQNEWRVAISTSDRYYVGTVVNGHIQLYDEFERVPLPNTNLMNHVKKDKNISAFLSFSSIYRCQIIDNEAYGEAALTDLRYRNQRYYPYVDVVQSDSNKNILNSYCGWILSEQ